MNLKASIGIRIEFEVLERIDELVKDNEFRTTAEGIRECTKLGLKVYYYRDIMNNPQEKAQFFDKLTQNIKNDKIFEWIKTLSPSQMEGIMMAIQMENKK